MPPEQPKPVDELNRLLPSRQELDAEMEDAHSSR
jgi:hypothetical protein